MRKIGPPILRLVVLQLVLTAGLANAQINWRCAFNPSLCGGPSTPPERTELCDLKVPDAYQLIYGPPPVGPGCLSKPDKVAYYSGVQTWVTDSEVLFEGDSAEKFLDYGFGLGIKFSRKWGSKKRDMIAFPTPEWAGGKTPIVFALAERWPFPYISTAQTTAIKAGACISKIITQVPGKYQKLNRDNCKALEDAGL